MRTFGENEFFHKYMLSYLQRTAEVLVIFFDEQLVVRDCNEALLRFLDLNERPAQLTPYLLPESREFHRGVAEGEAGRIVQVSFLNGASAAYMITGQLYRQGDIYLFLAEKRELERDEVVEKTSLLNNEMANLAREVNKKNLALQKANIEITRLLRTDALTGLYNRRHFMDHLASFYSYSQRHNVPLSLVMADVDDFKRINDHYGHQAGDQVLIDVARMLHRHSRQEDMVARFGGEEFVILLLQTRSTEARVYAERVRRGLAGLVFPHITYPVTASFGISQLTMQDTPETLLDKADEAMYRAKRRGKNQVIIYEP